MKLIDIDFSLALHNRTGKYFIGRDLIETPDLPLGDTYYWRLTSLPTGLARRVVGRLQLLQIKGRTLGGSLGWLPPRRPTRPLLHMDPFTVPTTQLRPCDIVVCHDVGPVTHPNLFAPDVGAIYDAIYRSVAEVGPHMVFVSHASLCAFGQLYSVSNLASTRVIYPAIRTDLTPRIGIEPRGVEGPFLLTVGSLGLRKNQERCIRAFARSGLAQQGIRYVICGGREPGFEVVATAAAETPGVILLPYVTDEELAWLYAHASGFVLVSLLEGFGMPVAEAIAQGQTPLVSSGSVLEEVAGDGAFVADPENVESIADGMAALIDLGPQERQDRLQRLTKSIARFDLDRIRADWLRAFAEWGEA
jgi:glycosyltransferase involved in cell wall biosynthesis